MGTQVEQHLRAILESNTGELKRNNILKLVLESIAGNKMIPNAETNIESSNTKQ